MLLHFGAVDYRAEVWVNGKLAGEHEGGHVPFRIDITDHLKAGTNSLTVRAEDPPTDRYTPAGSNTGSAFARMKTLGDAIASIPAFAEICYTQLTDVEQEINGLMTYDRKPKFNIEEIKRLNDRLQ